MVDIVINEVLFLIFSHFENVPNKKISEVISNFYDDELIKSKIVIHDFCVKILDASKVPRIIAHSKKNDSEKRKKLDADDILRNFLYLMV